MCKNGFNYKIYLKQQMKKNNNKMIYYFIVFIRLKHQTKPIATQQTHILSIIKHG